MSISILILSVMGTLSLGIQERDWPGNSLVELDPAIERQLLELDHPDPRQRKQGRDEMRRSLSPALVPKIIQSISDRSLQVRLGFREVLVESTSLFAGVVASLLDESPMVRRFAVDSLHLIAQSLQHRRRFDGLEQGQARRHRRVFLEASALAYLPSDDSNLDLWTLLSMTRFLWQDRPLIFDPRLGDRVWDRESGQGPFAEIPAEVWLEQSLEERGWERRRFPSFHWVGKDIPGKSSETSPRQRLEREATLVRSLGESLSPDRSQAERYLALDGLTKLGIPGVSSSLVRALQDADSLSPRLCRSLTVALAMSVISSDVAVERTLGAALLIDGAIHEESDAMEVRLMMHALYQLRGRTVYGMVQDRWSELRERCVEELARFCALTQMRFGIEALVREWSTLRLRLSPSSQRAVLTQALAISEPRVDALDLDAKAWVQLYEHVPTSRDDVAKFSEQGARFVWNQVRDLPSGALGFCLAERLGESSWIEKMTLDSGASPLLRMDALASHIQAGESPFSGFEDTLIGRWLAFHQQTLLARRAEKNQDPSGGVSLSLEDKKLDELTIALIAESVQQWRLKAKNDWQAILMRAVSATESREIALCLLEQLGDEPADWDPAFAQKVLTIVDRLGYRLSLRKPTQVGLLRGGAEEISTVERGDGGRQTESESF